MSESLPSVQSPQELSADAKVPDIVRYEFATGRVDAATGEKMLQLQILWEKNEAEKAFNAAFARLKFPPIKKTKKSLNSYYPPWEEVQAIIEPILGAEGFGLTFTASEPNPKNMIAVTGTLLHRLGHSRESTVYQPIDAVSKGMNANQAIGSATTYGQRYCARMMLNLRFVGLDDDAASMSLLTQQERNSIEDILAEIGGNGRESLLAFTGYKAVSEIKRGAFHAAMSWCIAKRRQMGQKRT